MEHFMGESVGFWIELKRRFENDEGRDAATLLSEVVMLRGKVSYYESRIKEMAKVAP